MREELDRNTTYVGSGAFFSFFFFFWSQFCDVAKVAIVHKLI